MKLLNEQDKNNHPSKECGEKGTAALEANSGHSETMSSVKGTTSTMKLLKDQDENNCCPSEHKYRFSIPMDKTSAKFTTGPSTGSSKGYKTDATEWERVSYVHRSSHL